MRLIVGTTVVTTAGTAVRLQNTADEVLWFKAHIRAGASDRMFIGLSDVAATVNAWELEKPVAARPIAEMLLPIPPGGSVPLNTLWADAAGNGDRLDWVAIVR